MPNHVKNVLKFINLKSEDISFIMNTIATKYGGECGDPAGHIIDFDKIIPEPRTEEDCPEECKVNKDSHIMSDETRPWFDWYEFHTKYWGTKWNAYDGYVIIKPSSITFVFSTAWSSPAAILPKLKLLGYNMEYRWADEDIGSNCGKAIYNPERTGFTDWVVAHSTELANPRRFASDLWRKF